MSSKTIDIELVYSFSLYFMSVVYIEKNHFIFVLRDIYKTKKK